MTNQRPEPPENAGINAIRLDADRTRDELERTLEELERRLDPRPRIEALKSAYRRRPVPVIALGVGVLGAIGGLITLAVMRKGESEVEPTPYIIIETKPTKAGKRKKAGKRRG